jgi:hypothetical protein
VLFHNFCVYHIDPPGHEVCCQSTIVRLLEGSMVL